MVDGCRDTRFAPRWRPRRRRARRRRGRPDRARCMASSLLDEHDEVLRPAILWNDQRTAAECDLIRAAVGPERLVEITGNDALTGLTAPKLVWVRDHEPDIWARDRATSCCPRTTSACDSPASTRWTRPTARARCCSILPRATGRPRWSTRWTSPALAAADLRGPGRSPASSRPQAAAATGLVAGTPVVAGGGDQSANAVGVGAVAPGAMALSLGTSGVVFAEHRHAAVRATRPSACLLPRRARDGGT